MFGKKKKQKNNEENIESSSEKEQEKVTQPDENAKGDEPELAEQVENDAEQEKASEAEAAPDSENGENGDAETKSADEIDQNEINEDILINESAEQENKQDSGEGPSEYEQIVKADEDIKKLTAEQQKQYEKLGEVRQKITKILNTSNVEIVDENIGDEFVEDEDSGKKKKQEQDYDELKELFGESDKNKKHELTLTIDDFDYSYRGQYVDELDMLHVKSIKKIKLQRKHSKHFKRLIIAASILLVVGIAVMISFLMLRKKPVELVSAALNQQGNTYMVNQSFKYTGLYIQAKYSDGSSRDIQLDESYLVDIVGNVLRSDGEITFLGGTQVDLVFSYNGFRMVYTITLKSKTAEKLGVYYSDGLFDLKANSVITDEYLMLLFGSDWVELSSAASITVDGTKLQYSSERKGFLVTNDITAESSITVEYNGLTLTFSYEENSGIVTSE